MSCRFFIKQVWLRHFLGLFQTASQTQLESAWSRSDIMSNVPFAFDKMEHSQLFTLSDVLEAHDFRQRVHGFHDLAQVHSHLPAQVFGEGGWSFQDVFAVHLLLWLCSCWSAQARLVVEVWPHPHRIRGTDWRSHFLTHGAAQKQERKVCPPTVCGRPFRTPFWATGR